ncbi:type III-B CRISPR module-associated Cmr3 family protein [Hydrogenophaga sp. NH-16]|uniref:type III-B CRISPR module-associated Cmr3 family protein n=1 Tax=Hydrogenophaga sp. NH-16 TaxID=2184519 RepID=UPI000FDA1607|nr:type III-B CRISPR module-associated Cmr3 family protein [Hydrogenophaga sp. NH-16]
MSQHAPNMSTTKYLLHPRSPLVFGTGKPLDFGLGGDSLAFPFPATVAGALRAALSAMRGQAPDPYSRLDASNSLAQLSLACFDWLEPDAAPALLLPRPADAAYLGGYIMPLVPQADPEGCWTDLEPGLKLLGLQGPDDAREGKPDPAPAWWSSRQFSQWLQRAEPVPQGVDAEFLDTLEDTRVHVVIDQHGKGSVTGGLFRSTGRDFGPQIRQANLGQGLALAISVDLGAASTPAGQELHGCIRRLGGEGRFVRFEQRQHPSLPWEDPAQPNGLDRATRVRFVLTTPAVFPEGGWRPEGLAYDSATQSIRGAIDTPTGTVRVTLVAAAISRAQSYSGWQLDEQGFAGPGRPWRVVPAGSVFWFDLASGDAPRLWGQSLCKDTDLMPWRANGWGRGFVGLA